MKMSLTWLGHSSVLASDSFVNIYFDPWKLKAGLPDADIIIISHNHHDHYNEDDIKSIFKKGTRVVAPFKTGLITDTVKPGEALSIGDIAIKAYPSYNIDKPYHPQKNNWAGYVITIAGKSIYHPGDTDRIPEMKNIRASIAFMPCGGTFTMSASEAALAASDVGAEVAVPIHWGEVVGGIDDAKEFKRLASCTVHILKPYETIILD
jgi:L-ascorbate metabolism protein UlaG (beta-lactamase superfamily)